MTSAWSRSSCEHILLTGREVPTSQWTGVSNVQNPADNHNWTKYSFEIETQNSVLFPNAVPNRCVFESWNMYKNCISEITEPTMLASPVSFLSKTTRTTPGESFFMQISSGQVSSNNHAGTLLSCIYFSFDTVAVSQLFPPVCATLSPRIVTGSFDKTVRLWSPDGQLLHRLSGALGSVTGLVYLPISRALWAAAGAATPYLYDPKSGDNVSGLARTTHISRPALCRAWFLFSEFRCVAQHFNQVTK